ncbi:MAG: hypothetical protein ACYCW9_07305, partial [Thermoplasmata archaeon]
GHPAPLPSLRDVDLATVRSYGPELTLVKIAQELRLIELIDGANPKGGATPTANAAEPKAVRRGPA